MEPEVVVTFPEGKSVEASYKDFIIRHGDWGDCHEGSVPSPFDLFVVALATCTASNVLAFMSHRDIPAEEARVIMRRHTDREKKMIAKFSFEVLLPADFPEKYLRAIHRAADVCAVKQHMLTPPEFETEVKVLDG